MTGRAQRVKSSSRYTVLLVLLMGAFLVIAGRLTYLQAAAAPRFAERATDQRLRDIAISPQRGAIYDREGEPLAVSTEACTVYAVPQSIDDPVGTSAAIASVLGTDPGEYVERLSNDTSFTYIARKLDMDHASALKDLDLIGIEFQDDSRRVYPSGELACQVLGFVGIDDEGLAGLESQYQTLLAGTPGSILAERDPFGRVIPGGVMQSIDAVDGQDIVLTIDKDIQYQAQVELTAAVEEWGAKSGSVVIMNPQNGEIYAMATVPGFNPNTFGSAEAYSYRNRPVTDVYEPGSTLKSLTAAAVIEEGLYGPDDMFELPPTLAVADRVIKESHSRPTVNWSLTDIVTNSSNVGAVMLGIELGEQRLYDYLDLFGMNERTGVDYPGEGLGYLPPLESWSGSTIGTIPFGQGISMTQLQLA
ncbi:MAG: penicillin-binding protein 2, partial [Actinomycetota bacterium]|nr:penicillin-binding protein 2 [Actinomycetota bacterium]